MTPPPYKKSPLVFDQVIVGPVISVLIIHDTKKQEWHCLEVDTEKIKFTELDLAILTSENLPIATGFIQ